MTYTRFDEHFWGSNGFDVIEKRLVQGSESAKLLAYFLEERAIIEETYSKGLLKLLKATQALTEFGTLREAWFGVRGETENLAKIHHDLSVTLHKDLAMPMKKFKDDQQKVKSQYLADVWKLNKERRTLDGNIVKSKEKYFDFGKKYEQAQQKVEQAKSQGKPPAAVQDLTLKAQKSAKEEMLFEQEYKEAITKLAQFQPIWEEKLTVILQQLQAQEEERIDYVKERLNEFVKSVEIGAPYLTECCKRLRDIFKKIDKKEDIMCFIRENATGAEKPEVPSFQNHKGGSSSSSGSISYSASAGSAVSSPSYSSPTTASPSYAQSSPVSSPASSTAKKAAPMSSRPAPGPPVSRSKKTIKALYDYVGTDANELDFFAGDVITVLEEDDSGWWTGELDGRKGLFPYNYCQ